MLADVRGNLIAAHQNIQRTREYLNIDLAYFSSEDSQVHHSNTTGGLPVDR